MEQPKRTFVWKRILCAAAAVMLLTAAGFGVKAIIDRGKAPAQTAENDAAQEAPTGDLSNTDSPEEATAGPKETPEPPMGYIPDDEVRYNSFLTAVVQQNIENTETDLDDDAELVRFVFGYRRYYEAGSIAERENADGVVCRTLTPEQVNETLSKYFERTVTPDREDYSIPNDEKGDFTCVFHDGCFWNVPPYPAERFDFPLRFTLVDRINEKTKTLHFRLYRINPDVWGEGEAERHVPLMPMMSIYEAENPNEGTKNWILKIGEGTAVLTDLGEEMKLAKMTVRLY